jgi:hypothetical protein
MHLKIGRVLLAVISSAGLFIAGAVPAGATSGHDGDHGKRNDYGWVKVCQNVKKYGDDKGKDDYVGRYRVKDRYSSWTFKLEGRYACRQVKVRAGKVAVGVLYKPDYTDLYGSTDRYLHVKRDRYANVAFEYKALDYGWVKVCQDVKSGDHGKDDNTYDGRYKITDSYGTISYLDLEGTYDCDEVKVHTGKADVEVVHQPDHTYLTGDHEVDVYVDKGEYETVKVEYKVVVDYGWVKVCQDIKTYGDDGKDDDFRGAYKVTDYYGNSYDVYLESAYDCDQVKVRTGKADVKVLHRPDHTYLQGDDDVYVDVHKDEYKTVTFQYTVSDDDYSLAGRRAA